MAETLFEKSTLRLTIKEVNSWGKWRHKNKIEAKHTPCTYFASVLQPIIEKGV